VAKLKDINALTHRDRNIIITCPLIEMGNNDLADIERQITSSNPEHRM